MAYKIITMVGTSIFENYIEERGEGDSNFKKSYEALDQRSAKELEEEKRRRSEIEQKVKSWIDSIDKDGKRKASAELSSIVQIMRAEKMQDKSGAEIYLLASDTARSRLASEILKEKLPDVLSAHSLSADVKEPIVIDNLQVENRQKFTDGMANLIKQIYKIADEYWGNVIINITGGYKATLPYLTVLALVNRCPIYYIFEKSDELIKIPYLPISIKQEILEKHEAFFMQLEREGVKEIPRGLSEEERNDIEILLERADDMYALNPLGVIFWEKYKSGFYWLYLSPDFKSEFETQSPAYKEALEESMKELARRLELSPSHPDLHHSLKGVELPKGFEVFKHSSSKELQVRLVYKKKDWASGKGYDIYVALGACGSEVHNAGGQSEYVEKFDMYSENIEKLKEGEYSLLKLER